MALDFQALIDQKVKESKAKQNVADEVLKNKIKIVMPFAEQIWNFLEIINKDKSFLFSSQAYPNDTDWASLFPNNDFDATKKSHLDNLRNNKGHSLLTRAFGYGNSQSRYIHIGIDDEFRPYASFSIEYTVEENKKKFSVEEFVDELLTFLIQKRKQ